jgi:hypothetical protein
MILKIEIECTTAAFDSDEKLAREVKRILRNLADRIEVDEAGDYDETPTAIHDSNGNRVGVARFAAN